MKGVILDNLRRYKLNSLLVRVTALVLLGTALFNVVMGVYYHQKSREEIRGEVEKTNAEVLRRMLSQWDESIALANSGVMQLANNIDLLRIMDGIPTQYEKLTTMSRLQQQMSLMTAGDSTIEQVYVYFSQDDWLIDLSRIGHGDRNSSPELNALIYETMQAYSGRFSAVVNVLRHTEAGDLLTILFPLPIATVAKSGCVVFDLNVSQFSQAVARQGIGWMDGMLLSDKSGAMLLPIAGGELASAALVERAKAGHDAQSYSANGMTYWVHTAASPVTGWTITGIVDDSAFNSHIMALTRAVVSVMLLITLIIIVAIYLLFMRFYAPLARLQDRFGKHDPQAKNELASIERHVDATIGENQRLDTLFNDNLVAIRESFLLKLLRAPVSPQDYEAVMHRSTLYQLKVDLFSPYVLLLTVFDVSAKGSANQLDAMEIHVLRILGHLRATPLAAEHVLYQPNIILTLLNITNYRLMKKEIAAYAQRVAQQYDANEAIHWRMLSSAYCEEAANAHAAYGECLRALPIGFSLPTSQVTFLDELELGFVGGSDFILEAKAEIALLLQADTAQAAQVLERTWQQIGHYENPERLLDFFIAQLIGTLEFEFFRKEAVPNALTEDLHHLYALYCGERDYARIKSCLNELLAGIAHAVREQKTAQHRQTVLLAEAFMQKNYHRDISLEDVADAVMLSPTYFSRVFSENTGTSYKERLAAFRIEAAKALLRESQDMADVMRRSGFTNPSTFHRVFKKHTGVTPGEYRETEKKETT